MRLCVVLIRLFLYSSSRGSGLGIMVQSCCQVLGEVPTPSQAVSYNIISPFGVHPQDQRLHNYNRKAFKPPHASKT